MFGAGADVRPWLGIEGAIGIYRSQEFRWRYTYNADQDILTSHRDTPVLVYVRMIPPCFGRLCVQPLVGLGLTHHGVTSTVTLDCEPRGTREKCAAVTPGRYTVTEKRTLAPTFAAGVDAPWQLAGGVSIAPTFRLLMINRDDYLTTYFRHRGPPQIPALLPTFGVAVTWTVR